MEIFKLVFLSFLFLFTCNRTDGPVTESKFYFEDKNEILSLHGYWKVTSNPDFNPSSALNPSDFQMNYIPRMWFNSGIKDKYIVSYTMEIFFSEDVLNNKFGILVFKAINSNETYVNGKLIGKKGFVSKDKLKIQNNASPSLYLIPDNVLVKGKNRITIRVADNAASGGFLEAPRLCEINICEKSYNRFLLITGGTGFFMLFIGFYHMLLFLGNRKDKSVIYFGAGVIFHAFTFLGFERVTYFFTDTFLIHFYTMNLGYCFSCLFALIFIHSFLERKNNLFSRFLLVCFSLSAISTLFAGVSLDYRSIHSRYILLLNVMCLVPMLSIQVTYLIFKAIQERKVGSNLILMGFLFFIFTNLLIPLHILHIIPTKAFTMEGSLILITCVTFALSRKTRQNNERLLFLEMQYRTDLEKEVNEKTNALEQYNKELQKSNQMKDKLFSIIAHDLRNPLFALEEVISLFQDKHLTAEALEKNIVSLQENLENNKFLLENLLQWSYIQLGYSPIKLVKIDIQKIIEETIQLHKGNTHKKRISILVNKTKYLHCYGDEWIIRLILRNLISNAIKFTPHKGKIEISYGRKKSLSFISVTDNGIGIHRQRFKNFFDRPQIDNNTRGTDGEGGSGIGLTLCKDFAERMNGKMTVKSKEKKGSKFTMTWEQNEF